MKNRRRWLGEIWQLRKLCRPNYRYSGSGRVLEMVDIHLDTFCPDPS